ncbi:MAG: protease modulator HflK [Lentisphaeria bacterium]|nr:protease modulator HflK [Lentisphaeria bacterium]
MIKQHAGERICGVLSALVVVCACVVLAAGHALGMPSFRALAGALLTHAALLLLAFLHCRLRSAANREAQDAGPTSEKALFEEDSTLEGERARALRQAESWALPAATFGAALAIAAECLWLWRWGGTLMPAPAQMPGVALCLVLTLVFFLVARYVGGLAEESSDRLLEAPAANAILLAVYTGATGLLGLAQILAGRTETRMADASPQIRTRVLAALLGLLVLELALRSIAWFYRSKKRRRTGVAVYASGICRPLVHPGAMAGVLDLINYQFGLDLVQGGTLRVAGRVVAPLVLLTLAILVGASCLTVVNPGEQAIVSTFGKPASQLLEPGAHFTWPWPVQSVKRFSPQRLRVLAVGIPGGNTTDSTGPQGLWRNIPARKGLYLTPDASAAPRKNDHVGIGVPPANLLAARLWLHYSISDPFLFFHRYADTDEHIRRLGRRELLAYLAEHDALSLLTADRALAEDEITRELQKKCVNMGVRVVSVGFGRLQPPAPVVAAFQQVSMERQQRITARLEAQKYANETLPEMEAKAKKIIAVARAEAMARTSYARGFADAFEARYQCFLNTPRIYKSFSYLDRLEAALHRARKIVVATDLKTQTMILDLKSSVGPELLDIPISDNKPE